MKKRTICFLTALLFFIFSLSGCGGSDEQTSDETADNGSIKLEIRENLSRTLIPAISMEPAAYLIEGAGPDGAGFSLETEGSTDETIDELPAGDWTVTVTAYNGDNSGIGSGSGTTTVTVNQTSSLSISVTPYSGFGTLSLDLDWEDDTVSDPVVVSSLTPASGAVRDLEFTLSGSSASFTASDVPTGYHTLNLQLFDGTTLTMGTVEVVRIVNGETTTGSYLFDMINQAEGRISINITADMADPLDVTISGGEETKSQDQTLSLSASVSNYENNVSYVWYVNGTSAATGESFDFDNSYKPGCYRIDVTAYSSDGSQAGSSTCFIQVSEDKTLLKSVISAGVDYTQRIKDDATLWANGDNLCGQLGDGTMEDKLTPVNVMSDAKYVSAGWYHTMIIKNDNTLWAVGNNGNGRLGIISYPSTPLKIMSDVKYVAAGRTHTLIIKNDGTLWTTGNNDWGQLGDSAVIIYDPYQSIDEWSPIQVMSDVKYASAGYNHTMIIKNNGTLWATGGNSEGQLGESRYDTRSEPVQIMSDVKYVSAGHGHTMIIKNDGTLWATGMNNTGQIGDGTTTNRYSPLQIMTDVKYVAAGFNYTMIIKNDDTLWATGWNNHGQLGDGTTENKSSPIQIMSDVKYVATGRSHTIIVKNDGTLWATGANSKGQLGDGTTEDKSSPVQITL